MIKENILPHLTGCLIGCMVGDSIGLPYEGVSKKRQARLLPSPLRHRLFWGKGMVSDDTEHAVMTAAALAEHWGDPDAFQKNLLWRMKWWFLRLPAGIGMATGKALLKAWAGFRVKNCGVFSAGNGPCMRAPIIGVYLGHDTNTMKNYIRLSTELTHKDPKSFIGALAISLAAQMASRSSAVTFDDYIERLSFLLQDSNTSDVQEFKAVLNEVGNCLRIGTDEETILQKMRISNGITGYVYHTVPMVLFTWFKYQGDYKTSIEKIISCGGDTDTSAAILGGICGAQNGANAIPAEWVENILDYPLTTKYCERSAQRLYKSYTEERSVRIPLLFGPAILGRNIVFLALVLCHGFRRCLPPY